MTAVEVEQAGLCLRRALRDASAHGAAVRACAVREARAVAAALAEVEGGAANGKPDASARDGDEPECTARVGGVTLINPARGKYELRAHEGARAVLVGGRGGAVRIPLVGADVARVITGLMNARKNCEYVILQLKAGCEVDVGKARVGALLFAAALANDGTSCADALATHLDLKASKSKRAGPASSGGECVGVPCTMVVTDGVLFAIDWGLIFAEKLVCLPRASIAGIEFGRADRREFDLHVQTHGGDLHEFKIDAQHLPALQAWASRLAQLRARDGDAGGADATEGAGDESGDDGSDDDHDDYDDEDDEDEDADFNPEDPGSDEERERELDAREARAAAVGMGAGGGFAAQATTVVLSDGSDDGKDGADSGDSDDDFGVVGKGDAAAGGHGGAGDESASGDDDEFEWVDEEGVSADAVKQLAKRARH